MANTIHAPISYPAMLFSMHRSYLFEMMLVKENIDPETKQYFIRCSAIKLSTKCASKKLCLGYPSQWLIYLNGWTKKTDRLIFHRMPNCMDNHSAANNISSVQSNQDFYRPRSKGDNSFGVSIHLSMDALKESSETKVRYTHNKIIIKCSS